MSLHKDKYNMALSQHCRFSVSQLVINTLKLRITSLKMRNYSVFELLFCLGSWSCLFWHRILSRLDCSSNSQPSTLCPESALQNGCFSWLGKREVSPEFHIYFQAQNAGVVKTGSFTCHDSKNQNYVKEPSKISYSEIKIRTGEKWRKPRLLSIMGIHFNDLRQHISGKEGWYHTKPRACSTEL